MNNLKNKNIIMIVIFLSATLLMATTVYFKYQVTDQGSNYNVATSTRATTGIKKPDFANMQDVKEKKSSFIKYMLASIRSANKEICAEKNEVKKLTTALQKNKELNSSQQTKLEKYIKYYKIKNTQTSQEQLKLLDIKIGTAPTSFILAQAILESGWGSSRFAKNYNNYFGLHCFKDGCGVKASGANVYLETFTDATQSVLGYYNRLNTGTKFKGFRKARHDKLPVTELLNTLEAYSELEGNEYKVRLEGVIKHNKLEQYDNIETC